MNDQQSKLSKWYSAGGNNSVHENNNESTTICPSLGLYDDHSTCFAFPNPPNCCHRAKPPQPVKADYQAKYCLTARHLSCPVFTGHGRNVQWASFNPVARDPNVFLAKWKKILITIGGPFLFVSVFIIGMFAIQLNPSATVQLGSGLNTPVGQLEKTNTQAIAQATLPSPTVQSSTPTPGPRMGTPFGPTLDSAGRYVLHEVQPGETLTDLARQYHTTTSVLGAANQPVQVFLTAEAMLASAGVKIIGGRLIPKTILVVLPWRIDPEGVPQFHVISLSEDTRVDDLASREGISIDDLRYYNDLGEDLWIPAGRNLIIPEDY